MKLPELSEFSVPMSEFDKEVSVGDVGSLMVPVVVVSLSDGVVTLRKANNVRPEGCFRAETVDEMRKRILDEQEEMDETAKEEATEDESKE